MNKTFLEMANEGVIAMISKGLLTVPRIKDEKIEIYNRRAIHTYSWAVMELSYELGKVPEKVRSGEPNKKKPQKSTIITSK